MMPIRILQLSLAVFASILLLTFFQLQKTEIQRQHSESRSMMLKYFDALGDMVNRIQGQGLEFMVRGVFSTAFSFRSLLQTCRNFF
jgi:hypothetical protein